MTKIMSTEEIAKIISIEMAKDENELFKDTFERVVELTGVKNYRIGGVWKKMKTNPSLVFTEGLSERNSMILKTKLSLFNLNSSRTITKPSHWTEEEDETVILELATSSKSSVASIFKDLEEILNRSIPSISERWYKTIKPNLEKYNIDRDVILKLSDSKANKYTRNITVVSDSAYEESRKNKFMLNGSLKITLTELARTNENINEVIKNVSGIMQVSETKIKTDLEENVEIMEYLFDLYNIDKLKIDSVKEKIKQIKLQTTNKKNGEKNTMENTNTTLNNETNVINIGHDYYWYKEEDEMLLNIIGEDINRSLYDSINIALDTIPNRSVNGIKNRIYKRFEPMINELDKYYDVDKRVLDNVAIIFSMAKNRRDNNNYGKDTYQQKQNTYNKPQLKYESEFIQFDKNAEYVFKKLDDDKYVMVKRPMFSKEEVLEFLGDMSKKIQVITEDGETIAKNYLD